MEAVEEIEADQFKEHTDNRANTHIDNVQPVKEIDYRANDHVADARIAHNVEARILYPQTSEDYLPVDVNVNPEGRPLAIGAPTKPEIDPGGRSQAIGTPSSSL